MLRQIQQLPTMETILSHKPPTTDAMRYSTLLCNKNNIPYLIKPVRNYITSNPTATNHKQPTTDVMSCLKGPKTIGQLGWFLVPEDSKSKKKSWTWMSTNNNEISGDQRRCAGCSKPDPNLEPGLHVANPRDSEPLCGEHCGAVAQTLSGGGGSRKSSMPTPCWQMYLMAARSTTE